MAGWVANSVDPGQMPHYAASDLGLHCWLRSIWVYTVCLGPSARILRVDMVFVEIGSFYLFNSNKYWLPKICGMEIWNMKYVLFSE